MPLRPGHCPRPGPGSSPATTPRPAPPEQASSKAIPAPGARPRQRLGAGHGPWAWPLAPSPTAPRPGTRRAAGTAPRAPTPPVGFGSLAHTLPDRESHSVLMDSGLNDELRNVSDVQKAGVWCPHTCQHSANATSYRETQPSRRTKPPPPGISLLSAEDTRSPKSP